MLTVEEAIAVNTVARWILGPDGRHGDVPDSDARDALELLAAHAHRKLYAGADADAIKRRWRTRKVRRSRR